MKNIQLTLLTITVIALVGFTVYDKINEKNDTGTYPKNIQYQVFNGNIPIPMQLNLAGEKVPLEQKDVLLRLDREIYVNTYWQSQTGIIIKKANIWLPIFAKILKENGIPEDFKYLPIIESQLTNVISPAGATGYWQFMPETARELGLELSDEVDERYHPIKSAHAAAKYLKIGYQKFQNWTNVAASYNAGMGAIEYALASQRVKSYYDLYLNAETSRYVMRLLAFKEIYENQKKYGYIIDSQNLYTEEPTKTIKVTASIPNLIDWAVLQGVSYKVLRDYNPWIRKSSLTIKNNKSYEIVLPINYKPTNEFNPPIQGDSLKK